jgi:hypothetical protein
MTGAVVEIILPLAALELAAQGWAVFPCKWRGEDAKAPWCPRRDTTWPPATPSRYAHGGDAGHKP